MATSKDFECFICLSVAVDAVESLCCHHIMCEACDQTLKPDDGCPQCRKTPFFTAPSHFARRIIGNMPVICRHEGCNSVLSMSDLKIHEAKCSFAAYECPCEGCDFKGIKKTFTIHLIENHEDAVINNAQAYFGASKENFNETDRIASHTNAKGRTSRLGENSKYYCGGSLDGPPCRCCNGRCGPGNGCNCRACMILDVTLRKLPFGWYVNRAGGVARRSNTSGLFYCGRKVMEHDGSTDGYCGPTDGAQCIACNRLERQIPHRYQNVWKTLK